MLQISLLLLLSLAACSHGLSVSAVPRVSRSSHRSSAGGQDLEISGAHRSHKNHHSRKQQDEITKYRFDDENQGLQEGQTNLRAVLKNLEFDFNTAKHEVEVKKLESLRAAKAAEHAAISVKKLEDMMESARSAIAATEAVSEKMKRNKQSLEAQDPSDSADNSGDTVASVEDSDAVDHDEQQQPTGTSLEVQDSEAESVEQPAMANLQQTAVQQVEAPEVPEAVAAKPIVALSKQSITPTKIKPVPVKRTDHARPSVVSRPMPHPKK